LKGDVKLDAYLHLTDAKMIAFIDGLQEHSDPTIAFLARSIMQRRPPICFVVSKGIEGIQRLRQEEEKAAELGFMPSAVVIYDDAGDVPYKPYEPNEKEADRSIRVLGKDGNIRDIVFVSANIIPLSSRYNDERIYYPRWEEITRK